MPEEQPNDSRPHFVIPYWSASGPGATGDDGNTRPLPSNVVSYLCPAIHASPYRPGEQLDVTVDIGNFGGANTPSIAQVTVWWADPATGFVVGPDRLIGFVTVPVPPRGGQATTPTLSKEIPGSAPDHICLLARVSHQYDRAGVKADPINDRHWAQRNLVAVSAQPGVPFVFAFDAGNPLPTEAEFILVARQVGEEQFAILAEELQREPTFVDADLHLGETAEGILDGGEASLPLLLQPAEVRRCYLGVNVQSEVGAGRFAAFEIVQQSRTEAGAVGSIGLVVTSD